MNNIEAIMFWFLSQSPVLHFAFIAAITLGVIVGWIGSVKKVR